jgi:hypothetical protein
MLTLGFFAEGSLDRMVAERQERRTVEASTGVRQEWQPIRIAVFVLFGAKTVAV